VPSRHQFGVGALEAPTPRIGGLMVHERFGIEIGVGTTPDIQLRADVMQSHAGACDPSHKLRAPCAIVGHIGPATAKAARRLCGWVESLVANDYE